MRHLAVECIQLGGLCYARVTMPLLVVSDENLHYIMYVCLSLSDNEQLRDGNWHNFSCCVMYRHMVVCLAVCFAKSIIFVNDSKEKIQM